MFGFINNIIEGNHKNSGSEDDQEHKKHIAAGVLLLEAAHADDDCSNDEMEHIVATLQDKFGLSGACVQDLIELVNQRRNEAIDIWQFTNHLNQHLERSEKLTVMEDVWRIVLLDGHLEKHEDHYAHKLASLLRLSHKEMIDAKLKAREQVDNG